LHVGIAIAGQPAVLRAGLEFSHWPTFVAIDRQGGEATAIAGKFLAHCRSATSTGNIPRPFGVRR
jgi:hypothetical protein